MANVVIDRSMCTDCGLCVKVCRPGVFEEAGGGVYAAREEACFLCGHCIAVCPVGAVDVGEMDSANFPETGDYGNIKPDRLKMFLRKRRSIRHYKDKSVPKDLLLELADIGRYAPTAKNMQDVKFIFVTDPGEIRRCSGMILNCFGGILGKLKNPLFRFLYSLKEGKETVKGAMKMIASFEEAREIYDNGGDPILYGAPVLAVLHAKESPAAPKDNCVYSLYNMVLLAEAFGLGTCINGYFTAAAGRDRSIPERLGVPAGSKVYAAMTLGYPEYRFHRAVDRNDPDISWI